jgi:branched-chain amino acid aminotransferase
MTKYCYINGKIIPVNKASVSLDDIGILRAYGVFEFLKTYNGKPFFLRKHLARLKRSAKILNLKIPISQKQLITEIKKLLIKNKFEESFIRIVLTGGRSRDGIHYDYNSPTFFILVDELKRLPLSMYQKGIKLITYEYQREISQAKTINYITSIKLQSLCKRKKALDVLYVSNGCVLEAPTSNFFLFKKNTLVTSKNNILIGITRDFVIKLAKDKFKIEERDILVEELKTAREAFITATNKEIVPVVKIDNKNIGNGKVGQNTRYLINLFQKYTKNY